MIFTRKLPPINRPRLVVKRGKRQGSLLGKSLIFRLSM